MDYRWREASFLFLVLLLAWGVRMSYALSIIAPVGTALVNLVSSWALIALGIAILYLGCKLVGRGWLYADRRARPQLAGPLTMGAAAVMGTLNYKQVSANIEQYLGNRGGSGPEKVVLDPTGTPGTRDWHWLRQNDGSDSGYLEAQDPRILKLALQEGATKSAGEVGVRITQIRVVKNLLHVAVEITGMNRTKIESLNAPALLVKYANGYFGQRVKTEWSGQNISIPLLQLNRGVASGSYLSPMILPENETSWEELLDGAELWIGYEGSVKYRENPRSIIPDQELSLLGLLSGDGDLAGAKAAIHQGSSTMDFVLDTAPWSDQAWEKVVMPYLLEHATEAEKGQLLEMCRRDPRVCDLFLNKGWQQDVLPVLRKHLVDGKKLERSSLLVLLALAEKEMGPMLENQLLRLDGDFDAVAQATQEHPGVDWNRVRKTAWNRVKFGFGTHHVWVKWGAEIGEKEALRILFMKAHSGSDWEREILESWFGADDDVVEKLRKKWDSVIFAEGQWTLEK
ncbi:hypothetical protein V2O64_14205 [Verrucomicrobiaceae bacterium 227]